MQMEHVILVLRLPPPDDDLDELGIAWATDPDPSRAAVRRWRRRRRERGGGVSCCPESTLDVRDGNVVCTSCATVVSRWLDQGAEWRACATQATGGGTNNPVRCAPASSPLLGDALGGVVTAGGGGGGGGRRLARGGQAHLLPRIQRWNALTREQRALCHSFESLSLVAAREGLPASVLDDAKGIYKRLRDAHDSRGDVSRAVFAASVYMACKRSAAPRSVSEIAVLLNVPESTLVKGYHLFQATVAPDATSSGPSQYVGRFCSRAGLDAAATARVADVARRVDDLGLLAGATPPTVVAAAMLLACGGGGLRRADVAEACKIAVSTAGKALCKLQPHADRLLA